MGSLADLTTYSENTFTVTDEREPGPKFNLPSVFDQTYIINDLSFTVDRQGHEVREIIRPSDAQLYYVIDTSLVPSATVSPPSTPAGVTVSKIDNMWYIGPITTVAQWDAVKDATVTLPNTFVGSFEYNVQWRWQNSQNIEQIRTYQVGLFIPAVLFEVSSDITTDASLIKTTSVRRLSTFALSVEANELIVDTLQAGSLSLFDYIPGNADAFGNAAPQLTTISSDPVTYSVTMTMDEPDILLSFSYSGTPDVGFVYNSSTKTATFSGNRTDVNTALQTIVINIAYVTVAYYWPYDITVSVTNSYNSAVDTFTVAANATDDTYLGDVTSDTYTTNTATTIQGGPEVDPGATQTGRFTTIIRPRDETQVTSFTGEQVVERDSTFSQTLDNDSTNTGNWAQHVLSENGDYLMIPGPGYVQVFLRGTNGTLTEQYEFTEPSGRYMSYNYENSVGRWYGTDMSSNGSYLAIGLANNADMASATNWYVQIKVRSGTSWSSQTELGPFVGNVINTKLTPNGDRLLILTALGEVFVYSRSGSTWSYEYAFTGVFRETLSGTDGGTPYSYTLTYDSAFTRRIGFCNDGTHDRIIIGSSFDSISPAISPGDPGYSTVSNYTVSYRGRYKIYRVNSSGTETEEKHIFKHEQPTDVARITSADFNSDASKAVTLGRQSSTYATNTHYVTVTNRSTTSWSNAQTLTVGQNIVDVAQADSTTDQVIVTMEQDHSTLQQRLKYFMAEGGSFVEQFTIAPSSAVNTGFGTIQPSLSISGDGNYISFVNPVYDSNSRTNGRYYEYTINSYGRVETGTKELTITANKTDTDNLIENWTMTPATGESETIQIVYFVTNPDGVTTSRIQDVDNT